MLCNSLVILCAFIIVVLEDEVVLDRVRGEVRVAYGQREGGRRRFPSSAAAAPVVRVVRFLTAAAAHYEGL